MSLALNNWALVFAIPVPNVEILWLSPVIEIIMLYAIHIQNCKDMPANLIFLLSVWA